MRVYEVIFEHVRHCLYVSFLGLYKLRFNLSQMLLCIGQFFAQLKILLILFHHFICNVFTLVFHHVKNILRIFGKINSASSTPAVGHSAIEYALSWCHDNSHAFLGLARLC